MPPLLGGLIIDTNIYLDKNRDLPELKCILYEEIGHYKTTFGNISHYNCNDDNQQEIRARRYGINKMLPYEKLIKYQNKNIEDYIVAEELNVPTSYLKEAVKLYNLKPSNGLFF